MEVVKKTKIGIYIRKNQDFGTLVFSPFSGLFFAVAKEFSNEIDAFCNSKQNNIPQIIADHLNIGIGKNKTTSFNIDHWLPSKKYFSDIDELPDRQPIVLNWLISSRCNCNCSYCYAGDIIDKKFENIDIRRAAQDLLNMNPLAVVLSGGEPLMEKQKIIDVLEIMGGKTGIIIDTNGLLFHKELIPLFIKYNIVIRVSLDSLQNGVNSKIRPQRDEKGNISGVNTIIQNIINYRHAGIPVLVHTVVSSMNKNSLEDLSKQLPRLNVNGWRIFTVVRPNDEAKKGSFDKLMKVGKVRNMDEAEKNLQKEINYFSKRLKSQSDFSIQILQAVNTKKNSVVLVLPDGTLATEGMFKSAKTEIDKDNLFRKVDLRSHYERYLGLI